MGGQFLLVIILFIAALALVVLYRLTVTRTRERSAIFYNLGMPCPDGVAVSPCPYCGQVFGTEVTEAARQECERQLRTFPADQKENTGVAELFQSIWWNVDCPSCGKQSSYVPQARILLHQGD